MQAATRLPLGNFRVSIMFCFVTVFCAVAAPASPAQAFTTIYNFCSQMNCVDGTNPYSGFVQGIDGNFYGTTAGGGANGRGEVFKISPSGAISTIYSFCSQPNCADGVNPITALILGSDGNFYGTTARTAFRLTSTGALTILYTFCSQPNCVDGAGPSGLLQAGDGNFYGTTQGGGANQFGTVFKLSPGGGFTTLFSFNNANGSSPYGALVQGVDGSLYGTTYLGGAHGGGTVFKITTGGSLTTLYGFCAQANCADGNNPYTALVQALDGNFYGTTLAGGSSSSCTGCGTVFKINPVGLLTTLYSFGGADGSFPTATLEEGTDGAFYGVTWQGGANYICSPGAGCGTIFRITANGTLSTLHSFDGTDGYFHTLL